MATLQIMEFENLVGSMNGDVAQCAKQPLVVAEQNLSIGAASVPSAAFAVGTRLVLLKTDTACSVVFGKTPVATNANMRLAANESIFFGVAADAPKLAVIQNP